MAIYGTGVDIVQIARITAVLQRTDGRFAEKVLGADELRIFHARRARSEIRGIAFLATRFAAKEAFSKAIKLGMRGPMTWRAIQTLNGSNGEPVIVAADELAAWLAARAITAQVSVSDERDYAVSFVVAYSHESNGVIL